MTEEAEKVKAEHEEAVKQLKAEHHMRTLSFT